MNAVNPTTGPARHHWLNTIVGLLDSAFYLSEEELYSVTYIVDRLLDTLHIPERDKAAVVPAVVDQEVRGGVYSLQLDSPRSSGLQRPVRRTTEHDCVASLEAWRNALENLVLSAYPSLSGEERVLLAKVLTDLLAAIGVPERAAAFFPDAVLRAHREIETWQS